MKLYLMLIVLLIASCTKKSGPEEVLTKYIDYRFSTGQDANTAADMLTGELKEKVLNMTKDELKIYLGTSDLKKKNLAIQSINCSSDTCSITYVLKYERADSKQPYVVENKKEAVLKLVDKMWKISDVKNIKTYIDSAEIGINSESKSEGL